VIITTLIVKFITIGIVRPSVRPTLKHNQLKLNGDCGEAVIGEKSRNKLLFNHIV